MKNSVNTQKIKDFVLEFASYAGEPFHIIIGALIEKKLCADPRDIVDPLLDLVDKGYLEVYYISKLDKRLIKDYKRENLREKLFEYIEVNKSKGFENPSVPEYEFKTTDKGREFIKDDT
jgi:hypothetical protein